MAKRNLQQKIDKQREQEKYRTAEVDRMVQDNAQLITVLDRAELADRMQGEDMKGFSYEQIKEAAKFALKTKPYDLDAESLDVEDSPIYYKENKSSRWFWNRKKLNDRAELLITKARELSAELEAQRKAIQEQKEKEDWYEETMGALTLEEVEVTDLSGPIADSPAYLSSLEESKAYQNTDQALTVASATMSRYFSGTESEEKLSEKRSVTVEGKQVELPSVEANAKQYLDEVDRVLDSEMKTGSQFRQHVLSKLKEKIRNNVSLANGTKESIQKVIEQQVKSAKKFIARMDQMFKKVEAGELSLEVLKIWASSHLMLFRTKVEEEIYCSMIERTEEECHKYTKEERKELNKKIYDDPKEEDRLFRVSQEKNWSYFHGLKESGETVKRYYISATAGNQIEMHKLFDQIIAKPKYKELADRIEYKVSTKPTDKRRDSMVLYIKDNVNQELLKQFLQEVSQTGTANGMLEKKQNMPAGNTFVYDGISTAPEFETSIYSSLQSYGFMTDRAKFNELQMGRHGKSKQPFSPAFSYTTYFTKALFLSAEIVRKRHGFKRAEVMDKIQSDEALNKEYKKLVADFMYVGGCDPIKMERRSEA